MENFNKLIQKAQEDLVPLQEKSEGRESMEALASTLIEERIGELGLPPRTFNTANILYKNSIDYHDSNKVARAAHYTGGGEHKVTSPDSGEANLPVIVHELLHAYSADVSSLNLVEGTVPSEPLNRDSKTGFSSVYRKGHDEQGDRYMVSFKAINEAVTEKLARELALQGNEQYKNLQPLFEGRKEEFQDRNKKDFEEIKAPQAKAEDSKRRHQIMLAFENHLDDLKRYIKLADTALSLKDIEAAKSWSDKVGTENDILVQYKKQLEQNDSEEIEQKIYTLQQQSIEENYSFDAKQIKEESYLNEIRLLNLFTVRHAEEIMKSEPEMHYTDAREQAWAETQKAYFEGNVFFLRKFDTYFGKDTLSRLENFSKDTKEKQEILLQKFKEKLDE